RAVCSKLIDGIPEKIRADGLGSTEFAILSRGVCGVRGGSLILNLPGSPAGAVDSLQSVVEILPHALELLAGNTQHEEGERENSLFRMISSGGLGPCHPLPARRLYGPRRLQSQERARHFDDGAGRRSC